MASAKTDIALLPSIISGARSRVEIRVFMGAPTARELSEYVGWVTNVAKMPQEEVLILTMDKALGDFFRRDRGWQATRAAALASARDAEPIETPKAAAKLPEATVAVVVPTPPAAVVAGREPLAKPSPSTSPIPVALPKSTTVANPGSVA